MTGTDTSLRAWFAQSRCSLSAVERHAKLAQAALLEYAALNCLGNSRTGSWQAASPLLTPSSTLSSASSWWRTSPQKELLVSLRVVSLLGLPR